MKVSLKTGVFSTIIHFHGGYEVDLKQIISNNDSSYDACVYMSEGETLKSNESEMIISISIIYFLHIL